MSSSALYLSLSYVGSIALIVFGLRMLNERIVLSFGSGTRHRLVSGGEGTFRAAGAGFAATAGFQSFPGLSVLLLSLVNSSLVSPGAAFAAMFGAAAGVSVPLWILATGGFLSDLGDWALAAVAIIGPLSLVKKRSVARFGSGAVFFILVLLGVGFMKTVLPDSSEAPRLLLVVRGMADRPLAFRSAGFAIGIALSAATQSAGAVLLTALWLCWSGWLPLAPALALVFGSELGSILTVLRAAGKYGVESRGFAAALSLGMLFAALAGFAAALPLERAIAFLFPGAYYRSGALPFFLTGAFSLWTVAAGCLVLAARPLFLKASGRIRGLLPGKRNGDDLPLIARRLPDSLEANLITTRHEIGRMADAAHRMLMEVLNASQDPDGAGIYEERITELQEGLILTEKRVERSLTAMVRQPTGTDQAGDITAQIRVSRNLALIGGSCVNVIGVLERIRRKRYKIHDEALDELYEFIAQVLDFLKYDGDYLARKLGSYDQDLARDMESRVNGIRDKLRKRVRKTLEKDEHADIRGELQFMEIVRYLETIGDDCFVIAREIPRLR